MATAIGIGNSCSKIVEKLKRYKQYNIITLDSGKEVKEYKNPEEYEKNCPSFKKIFKNLDEDVFVFVSASGKISGLTLRVLEQLKGKNINVICISSDPITLSDMGNLQQNLVNGVLQEYARSGLISDLYLVNNKNIEELLQDVPLDEYWDQINETISYIFHTFLYFENTKPIMSFGNLEKNVSNIHTYCLLDRNDNKKMFYDLKYWTNEKYYFSYNKEKDKNFISKVKTFAKNQPEDKKIGCMIYETLEREPVTYARISTKIPHTQKTDFGSLDSQGDL